MPLFARKKVLAVQRFVLKLVNNNCPEMKAMLEGPRNDRRVNLVVVVIVVPLEDGVPAVEKAWTAITRDFSAAGVGVVLNEPIELDQAVLGFRLEGEMVFVRAQARHLNPMGGGFYQLGLEMLEIVGAADYPKLAAVSL